MPAGPPEPCHVPSLIAWMQVDMERPPISRQALLADQEWIHSVARALVGPGAEAEDLAQETLLAALDHPPAADGPLRPWLRRVLTNFARIALRREANRRARERERPRVEVESDPEAISKGSAIRRDVAHAVLGLEEPYRSMVLLRYYEGLSAVEIARRRGVAAATVRQRLKRARDLLRSALDRKYGGESRAWSAAALALARRSRPGWKAPVVPARLLAHPFATGLSLALLPLVLVPALWVLWRGSAHPFGPAGVAEPSLAGGSFAAQGFAPPAAPAPSAIVAGWPSRREQTAQEPAGRASGPEPGVAGPGRSGKLLVQVERSADGKPAAGEIVLVERDGARLPYPEELRVHTGDDGEALLEDLQAGLFQVGLLRRGDDRDAIRVSPGKTATVRIEMPAGFTVQGQVHDEDGNGIEGAELWVSEPWSRLRGHVLARTDGHGRFELRDLQPDGMHWVGARAPGRRPSPVIYFDAKPGEVVEHTFVLDRPGASLSGRVLDERGRPVAGSEVLVGYESAQWACAREGAPPCRVAVAEDGSFRMDDLPPGPQLVLARAPGRAAQVSSIDLVADVEQEVTIMLVPEPVVTGCVFDVDGRPLPHVRVSTAEDGTFSSTRAWSDERGRFELRGAGIGAVLLHAGGDGRGQDRVEMTLRSGARATWNPVLRPIPRVFGTLLDALDQPVAKRELALWQGLERRNVQYTFTDEHGSFAFDVAAEASSVLVVESGSRDFPSLVRRGVVASRDPLELRLADVAGDLATLAGHIVGADGAPVDGARLSVWHLGAAVGHDLLVGRESAFELRVPHGDVRIEAAGEGHPPCSLGERNLLPGERIDLGALVLPAPAFVVGHLHGWSLADPGSIRVDWYVGADRLPTRGTVEAGGFRSPPLPPGTHVAAVQGTGISRLELEVAVEEGQVLRLDVHLSRAPTRRVVLEVPPGAPRPTFLEVRLTGADGCLHWRSSAPSPPAGPIELRVSAPPGDYTLSVRADGGRSATVGMPITEGANQVLWVDMR